MSVMLAKPFMVYSKITKATSPEGEAGPWHFHAPPALTDEPDYDKQTLVKAGVLNGLNMWKKLGGHFDYAHQYRKTLDPKYLIAKHVGQTEIDGVPYVIGELYKNKALAKSVWEHLMDNGPIGLSIEGIVKALDPKDRSRVLDTEIHFITIDPAPKGFDGTRMRPGLPPTFGQLTKSLTAELEAGNVSDWLDVEDVSFEPITPDVDPYALWSPHAFLKAIAVGNASGEMPRRSGAPGDTGFASTMREKLLTNVTSGAAFDPHGERQSQGRVPQVRCQNCNTKNQLWRDHCRECGGSMKARS